MIAEDTPPAEPGMDPDRGDLVHEVLDLIPEHLHEVVSALLELPGDYEVGDGITVGSLVVLLCAERIDPDVVWRALLARGLVRPGLGGAP